MSGTRILERSHHSRLPQASFCQGKPPICSAPIAALLAKITMQTLDLNLAKVRLSRVSLPKNLHRRRR
jgi:hypothetical protein